VPGIFLGNAWVMVYRMDKNSILKVMHSNGEGDWEEKVDPESTKLDPDAN
jgi:hypothetical protein